MYGEYVDVALNDGINIKVFTPCTFNSSNEEKEMRALLILRDLIDSMYKLKHKDRSMKNLETALLKMWRDNGINEVYKYKNRIKAFREPLKNIELFADLTNRMFEDISHHKNSTPSDFKIEIDNLIKNRNQLCLKNNGSTD